MSHRFKSGEGALWIQRNGPNTIPVYLGCHQVGDIDEPEGDITLIYCREPSGPSRYEVVGSIKGAAGAVTSTITTFLADEIDELERVKCEFTLFVNMFKSGRPDVFTNFDRTLVFSNVSITSKGITSPVSRQPEDESSVDQSFDISAEDLLRLAEPTVTQQTVVETQAINDITFCNEQRCRTDEDVAQEACELGFAACDAVGAGTANVLLTTNGGTWAATTDPFGADEHIIAIECFDLGRDTVRVVCARGVTDAGNPAEISYSDDNGTTWTAVNVGSSNAEFVSTRFGLFALDRNNIWVASNLGRIYVSNDAALTWTVQDDQAIHSGAWNAIKFADANVGWAVGASNVVAKTVDGGTSWAAVTGPDPGDNPIALEVLDRNRVWVGYDNGKLYYTLDAGVTWAERAFTGSGVGDVRDIKFFNDTLGYMITDNASPVGALQWSIDGGYTWSTLTTPTNAGLNSMYICDVWNVFMCGEVVGSIGYIAKSSI